MLVEHAEFICRELGVVQLARQLQFDNHPWGKGLEQDIHAQLAALNHGDIKRWISLLNALPEFNKVSFDPDLPAVTFSASPPPNPAEKSRLRSALQGLRPWRKGPYDLFGTYIDTEWRSDMKWARIAPHLDLAGKKILDVGCANGYFGWRMLGAGARAVVGIEPSWLFLIQFILLNRYASQAGHAGTICMLPRRMDQLPADLEYFDWVVSMGVLYHRRSPFDHLFELKGAMKPGGKLLLETLVIPAGAGEVLVPRDRYARMRNVWFIPTTDVLCAWLERAGFSDIRVVDESPTTTEEQRRTEWLISESLEHCLDPEDPELTVEGYPAPRRAVVIAQRPG